MRVKQLWSYFPLPAKLKLLWDRITFSRITTFYFIFSIVHCLVQVGFQGQAFAINQQAATLLYSVIQQGNAELPPDSFPVLGNDLRVCTGVPSDVSAKSCQTVWTPKSNAVSGNVAAASQPDAVDTSSAASTVANATSTSVPASSSAASSTVTSSRASTSSSTAGSSTSRAAATSAVQSASKTNTVTVLALPTQTPPAGSVVAVKTGDDDDGEEDVEEDDDDDEDEAAKLAVIHVHKARSIGSIGDESVRVTQINGSTVINVTGVAPDGQTIQLDETCATALNWPVVVLHNTKREDVTFIAFQFWVLGMSIVALLNESIPHILATLLTHMLATAWAGFQIESTKNFHTSFAYLTTQGACKGHNLLPTYWQDRGNAEIPSLALNVAALFVSVFLSWRLIKLFGWQTFKRVGASLTVNRVYKVVLILSINLQLALFFILATIGIWIDQLCNGAIGHLAQKKTLYTVMSVVTMVLLIPWLGIGWFAVRREARKLMLVFLTLSVLYMAGWGGMFASPTFRWTFVTWRFFGVIACASVALTLLAFILGVVCRVNFGKGLLRYLNAEEPLPDDFVEAFPNNQDPEKVAFPSNEKPIPTFSAAFGSGEEVPVPSQMFANRQMGPRFYNQSADPFESEEESMQRSTHSGSTHSRSPSEETVERSHHGGLYRSDTRGSDRSVGSTSTTSSDSMRGKRWVIE